MRYLFSLNKLTDDWLNQRYTDSRPNNFFTNLFFSCAKFFSAHRLTSDFPDQVHEVRVFALGFMHLSIEKSVVTSAQNNVNTLFDCSELSNNALRRIWLLVWACQLPLSRPSL